MDAAAVASRNPLPGNPLPDGSVLDQTSPESPLSCRANVALCAPLSFHFERNRLYLFSKTFPDVTEVRYIVTEECHVIFTIAIKNTRTEFPTAADKARDGQKEKA